MSQIKFIVENKGSYSIDVLAYENQDAQLEDDMNWLFCTFTLSLLNTTMKYDIHLQTSELNRFKNELSDFLSYKCDNIHFTPIENNFDIKYLHNQEQIQCQVNIHDHYLRSHFSFQYETNKTD